MRLYITITFFLLPISSSSSPIYPFPAINAALLPATTSGNTECSAAIRYLTSVEKPPTPATEKSSNTTFQLTFISYGNWTALPSQDENPIQHLESVSFAVSNAANGVSTVCAFSLGATLTGDPGTADAGVDTDTGADAGAVWQACADRRDTDGKHRFTIATGAAFGRAERSLSLNQTWFCHDDAGRLVALTGVASTGLNLTCSESEVSGYHLQNCTSPDLALPIALL
ncbi:hypothetical protein GGS24DRAFT_507684 [Hypoxylon argillaceum]|nr:hypothetical protein GGS24DRAFT_507684 [Hypoxylon argillaceum]